MSERLQKYLARAGVASRRHAEAMINEGRIKVNNQVIREMGIKVEAGTDLVTVDGKLVSPPSSTTTVMLYKPVGVVTTLNDPQGRATISDYVREIPERLFPVGRLDYDAEGALLLTNDGALAHKLMHPSYQVPRTYLAKVKGSPDAATLEKLRGGVRLEDGVATPKSVDVFEQAEKNTWLKIVVLEGRQHLIKRLCAAVGHPVVRLFRPSYGGLSVGSLRPGQIKALSPEDIAQLNAAAEGHEMPDLPLRLPPRIHGHGAAGFESDGERPGVPKRRESKAEPEIRPRGARPPPRGFGAPRAAGTADRVPAADPDASRSAAPRRQSSEGRTFSPRGGRPPPPGFRERPRGGEGRPPPGGRPPLRSFGDRGRSDPRPPHGGRPPSRGFDARGNRGDVRPPKSGGAPFKRFGKAAPRGEGRSFSRGGRDLLTEPPSFRPRGPQTVKGSFSNRRVEGAGRPRAPAREGPARSFGPSASRPSAPRSKGPPGTRGIRPPPRGAPRGGRPGSGPPRPRR